MSTRDAASHGFSNAQALSEEPTVSVLLGVRNASTTVAAVIDAMKRQDYQGEWAMWIATAPSSDDTDSAVSAAVGDDKRFTIVANPAGDLASGFNLGLGASDGEVVAILSGHCRPDVKYLSACVACLKSTRAGLAGGAARPRGDGLLHGAIAIAHRVPFGLGGGAFRNETNEGWVDTAYVGAYPRAVLEEIGGWNEQLTRNQDIELNARVRRAGYGIYLSREVVVEYRPRRTLGALARQNYGNGFWNVRTAREAGGVLSLRHAIPGIFVAAVLLGIAGTTVGSLFGLHVLGLASKILTTLAVSLYLAGVAWASVSAAADFGWQYVVVLPAVFVTLHLSYGWGEVVASMAALVPRRR